MTQKVVIVGAGGFAREIASVITERCVGWDLIGFVQKDPLAEPHVNGEIPVVGDDQWLLEKKESLHVVIAVGNPMKRKKIFQNLSNNPLLIFPNIISPDVFLSSNIHLGKGCIICPGTIFTVDISLGDFVICNLGCTIGHGARLEDFTTLNPGVHLSGNVEIGEGAEIGTGTQIIQGKKIGRHSMIGAGSVVVRDIPDHVTAYGVPCKAVD